MKLEPINALDATANISPVVFSETPIFRPPPVLHKHRQWRQQRSGAVEAAAAAAAAAYYLALEFNSIAGTLTDSSLPWRSKKKNREKKLGRFPAKMQNDKPQKVMPIRTAQMCSLPPTRRRQPGSSETVRKSADLSSRRSLSRRISGSGE
ncbi:unnamed protein product [Linum trigynum]|uniref:Uncharacterized protein n=1 Tax=Linum trigynum TaxID=586398 RepID=A0AAV2EGQ3_9ROSI